MSSSDNLVPTSNWKFRKGSNFRYFLISAKNCSFKEFRCGFSAVWKYLQLDYIYRFFHHDSWCVLTIGLDLQLLSAWFMMCTMAGSINYKAKNKHESLEYNNITKQTHLSIQGWWLALFITRGPKGHISCTWVQYAAFLRNQPRRTFLFTDRPEKKNKLIREHWDLASCQVLLNSVQRFQRRSRKCLSQSEARAAILFFWSARKTQTW